MGEIPVAFEVTRMPNDVYVVVLRLYNLTGIYREEGGKVYVGAKGFIQVRSDSIVAGLVRCAVIEAKADQV